MFKKSLTMLLEATDKKLETTGRSFYVMPSTDPGYADFLESHAPYVDGVAKVYNTIADGYNAMVDNRNDVLYCSAYSEHAITAMITVSKNRCHFRGIGIQGGRFYGARAKWSMGVTAAATDLGVMKNTGVGNSFKDIKFMSTNTKAESLYSVLCGGEYALFENCEIYKETDLDETGAAELVLNGDSAQFKNCTIGSLANYQTGTVIRPCVLLTAGTVGAGLVTRDCLFENCLFWKNAGHVNGRFVYGANATDVERLLLFKNCGFINAKNSAAVPAQAIALGGTLTVGYIVCDPLCYGVNITKMSTTTGVIVAGATPNSGAGIAVNAA